MNIHKKSINIILSTYNGGKYLSVQIDSLLNQTCQDWILIIRDDGSTDNTYAICKEYVSKYPDKIFFVSDGQHLGACQSFFRLLSYISSEYIMFCDQDDVWMSNKIEITLNKMLDMESKYGTNVPLLVYTDLQVVDEDLNLISPSFWQYRNITPQKYRNLNNVLTMCLVFGCTMMINCSLKNKITYVPTEAIMHDWWIVLIAIVFGRMEYLNVPTIYYRQHNTNVCGVKKWNIHFCLNRLLNYKTILLEYANSKKQAAGFLRIYNDKIGANEVKNIISTYVNLHTYNRFYRRVILIKNKYFKPGILRNLILLLIC